MLYLTGYEIKEDSIEISVYDTSDDIVHKIQGEQQIRNIANKSGGILGVEVLQSTLLYGVYNSELVKLYGIKKPTQIGMKFEYRNWIEVTYIPTNNEKYEYTFILAGRQIKLRREYLLMQRVKFDLTTNFKSLPRTEKEYELERFLPDGFIPTPPAPTKEELRIAANQRRLAQEKARREKEQQEEAEKQRAKEIARQKALGQRELAKRQAKEQALQRNAKRINNLLKQAPKPEVQTPQKKQATPTKSFRQVTDQELNSRFEVVTIYKGFKICRSLDDRKDFAILCVKAKPILAKTIRSYVKPGEKIVTPFETLAATKNWINTEFY